MLTTDTSKNVYQGNGITTVFPFTFKVWDAASLLVQITDTQGLTTTITNYTPALSDTGGTITYMHNGAPLPEGYTIAILRAMPFTQNVNLISGTRFDPTVIEEALDKATAERQELREAVERSVKLEPTSLESPEDLIQDLRDNTALAVSSAQDSAQSAMDSANSADNAAASAAAAQKSADDAAKSAAEAGEAAGEAAVARVEAEGDTQVARVQTEGDTVLSSIAELASSAFLPGMVVAFTGSFGGPDNKHPIPTGSTEPDLTWRLHEPSRGRFILGGDGTSQGQQGGTAGIAADTGATTLTIAQMPYHQHVSGFGRQSGLPYSAGAYGNIIIGTSGQAQSTQGNYNDVMAFPYSSPTGLSHPHTHGTSLPPYYVLAYIEKLPSSGGGSGDIFVSQETFNNAVTALENGKQDTLEAGDNITIVNNVISATGGGGGGIEEAPKDGKLYVRQNGSWVAIGEITSQGLTTEDGQIFNTIDNLLFVPAGE